MKIIEIINSLTDRNGAQVFVLNLCKALKSFEDVDLYLISLYGNVESSMYEEIKKNGIKFYSLDKSRKIDFKASTKLKKIIKEIKPDIVNMHLSCLPTYFIGHLFKKPPYKLVQTFHTIPSHELGRLANYYIKRNLITYIGISDLITKKAIEMNNNILCKTIYNGVPLSTCGDCNTKTYDFIIVASMTPVKNHTMLFSAYKDIVNKYPKSKMICVGGGPLLNENKQFAKSLNLQNNIEFTGEVSNVNKYLNESRCLVLSSTREGNPIAILEAMNAGLPIIAPRVGGIPDVVKDDNGFLFDVSNIDALKRLMIFSIEDRLVFESIGQKNKDYVKKFDIKNAGKQYLDFYCEVLKTKH